MRTPVGAENAGVHRAGCARIPLRPPTEFLVSVVSLTSGELSGYLLDRRLKDMIVVGPFNAKQEDFTYSKDARSMPIYAEELAKHVELVPRRLQGCAFGTARPVIGDHAFMLRVLALMLALRPAR